MPAQLIGAHMSTKGGLGNSLRKGKEIGCTAIQVFTSSPQQWYAKPITDDLVRDFKKATAETGLNEVISHDSYLINLCSPDEALALKSKESLKNELRRSSLYGIKYVVSHMGAHKGEGEAVGLTKTADAALEVLADTPDDVMLLMETTAGQGTDLNCKFEHLGMLLELCKGHPRLGVCVDTCHIFVAGYDIRTPETWEHTWHLFQRVVGFDRLKAVHCNDSKRELGSRVDRHDHIGQGQLGEGTFRLLVNDDRFERIPIVIETNEPETMHQVNVSKLWSLIDGG
jgi:deoxyribonuclease IV